MSDLDLDDRTLWSTIYHGSSSEIEMVALALVAELRRERDRVATLEGELEHILRVVGLSVGRGNQPTDAERRVAQIADALLDVGPEVQPNPDDALALRHQKHYRQCGCLGDAGECCQSDCPCHDPEVQP